MVDSYRHCADSIPKTAISVDVSVRGPRFEPRDWNGSTRRLRRGRLSLFPEAAGLVGGSSSLGYTVFKLSQKIDVDYDVMPCDKVCCPDGGKGAAIYIKTIQYQIRIDILIKHLNWTNPPQAQRRKWERLKRSIIDHELIHAGHMKEMAKRRNAHKRNAGPLFETFCAVGIDSGKEALKNLSTSGKKKTSDYFKFMKSKFRNKYEEMEKEFHDSSVGSPIHIPDYIR